MGKIEANFFISLDGVVESPDQWHFDYFNDEMGAAIGQGTERYTGFLMGRVLYEEWSSYWPNQGDDVPFAPFINNIRNTWCRTRSTRRRGTTRRSSRATSPRSSGRSRTRPTATSGCPAAPRWCGGCWRTGCSTSFT